MVIEQGTTDGIGNKAADLPFVAEADFAFGGVDVDIDAGGIDLEEEAANGVAALHEAGVIAFVEGVVEAAILDGAAVDKEVLVFAGGAGDAGGADETPEAQGWRGWRRNLGQIGHRQRLRLGRRRRRTCGRVGVGRVVEGWGGGEVDGDEVQVGAVEGTEAFAEGGEAGGGIVGAGDGWELPDETLVLVKGKANAGEGEGSEDQVMVDMSAFGFLGLEELAAGGEVEEEVADFDCGSRGVGGGADLNDAATIDQDLAGVGRLGVAFAGGEGQAADAGDAGEGFTAKAHGVDGLEVFGAVDLAGGVALEAKQGVVAAHADPVVGDADETAPAGLDLDGDAGGVGVESVFDELFDNAGRALDDFAGGDLVGDLLGQQADAVHAAGGRG
jgi:hypothetical protein